MSVKSTAWCLVAIYPSDVICQVTPSVRYTMSGNAISQLCHVIPKVRYDTMSSNTISQKHTMSSNTIQWWLYGTTISQIWCCPVTPSVILYCLVTPVKDDCQIIPFIQYTMSGNTSQIYSPLTTVTYCILSGDTHQIYYIQ